VSSHSDPCGLKTNRTASQEDLKKTYSEADVGRNDRGAFDCELTGFGKHRIAASASKSWQLEYLDRQYSNDGDLIVGFLGDTPPIGVEQDIWDEWRVKNEQRFQRSRNNSMTTLYKKNCNGANTKTPYATPTTDPACEYIDPLTGTKVIRGFTETPSAIRSAPSSYRPKKRFNLDTIDERSRKPVFRQPTVTFRSSDDSDDCALASDDSDSDSEWMDED
jgi:hypothetical protein